MKQILLFVMMLGFATSTFCQDVNSSKILMKEDYLQKSKKQKSTAWILLGGGTGLAVGAALLDVSSDWSKSETPYLIAIITGGASVLGSIPLFIASAKNKRKAKAASTYFKMETVPVMLQHSYTMQTIPAISIKFRL